MLMSKVFFSLKPGLILGSPLMGLRFVGDQQAAVREHSLEAGQVRNREISQEVTA